MSRRVGLAFICVCVFCSVAMLCCTVGFVSFFAIKPGQPEKVTRANFQKLHIGMDASGLGEILGGNVKEHMVGPRSAWFIWKSQDGRCVITVMVERKEINGQPELVVGQLSIIGD